MKREAQAEAEAQRRSTGARKTPAVDMGAHFSARSLIRYALPAIAMMVFTSVYGIVDGLFVSNFAGKTAFAAVNLIMPFIMILGSIGFMMGSGGSALVATTRGKGDDARANAYFSLVIAFTFGAGVVVAAAGAVGMDPIAALLGASDNMLSDCVVYGRISMVSLPLYMLQYAFQTFSATAGKPKFGLAVTVFAGVMNMMLDFVFVALLGWGVAGAAWATVASEFVGGLVPLVYFARENGSLLRLVKPARDARALRRACVNGSSEMMSNVAISIVSIVYNLQLMAYIGEDGVAAYGTIMYAGTVFDSVMMGFCMGTAPLMSFQHGADNAIEKRSIFRKSVGIMGASGAVMLITAQALAWPIAWVFASYDEALMELTVHAFRIFMVYLLFMGFGVYGSSLFTALGNGLVSAMIAFVRALILEVGAVIVLPLIIGPDGIWLSVIVAEVASFILTTAIVAWLGPAYGIVRPSKGAQRREERRKRREQDCDA